MDSICPVETTLSLIGGKYKALILWHLSAGTLRFSQLQKAVTATPRMLTHSGCYFGDQRFMLSSVQPEGNCILSSRMPFLSRTKRSTAPVTAMVSPKATSAAKSPFMR